MRLLADENVPERYVRALRGDGHEVVVSRTVSDLGPAATDTEIVHYAEAESLVILTTDAMDFAGVMDRVPVLIAPQDMSGAAVRQADNSIEWLGLTDTMAEPIWLSTL